MSRKLSWASAILLVLGAGHLSVALIMDVARVADWLGNGLWATVPLMPEANVADLETTTSFWAGWGSFGVPLLLLGGLVGQLARRQVPVPSWVGWGLIVWAVIGGLMLVPSPFFVGVIPGVLIVAAARDAGGVLAPRLKEHPAAYDAAPDLPR